MDLKPPCASKEAIFLDFRNLSSFLDYLEFSQKKSFLDIADLKRTVSILPDILKDIKEIKNDQDLHRKMIDANERSIGNVSHRVFSLEENEKLFKEVI